MSRMNPLISGISALLIALLLADPLSAGTITGPSTSTGKSVMVSTPDGNDIPLQVYAARGKTVLLWLPSQHGMLPQEERMAARLVKAGVEVWLPDLHGARFLSTTYSSMQKIPAEDIAALVQAAIDKTDKTVFVMLTGRSAVPGLRGINLWRRQHPNSDRLHGAVMLSPDLYVVTPAPGEDVQYLPITGSVNIPVFILQPALSPKRWWVDRLAGQLSRHGAPVFIRYIPETKGRFFFRPDASRKDDRSARNLPMMMISAMKLLETVQPYWDRSVKSKPTGKGKHVALDRERKLKPYTGDPQPPALKLDTIKGGVVDLKDYRGQVVLVNFWATWCPPCRAEMPSMQRLKDKMQGKPFTILAVDMGETEAKVHEFLKDTPVDFTIMMDRDGAALRSWKVFAFPTSYLIDAMGNISYAVYGSREWDSEDVIDLIHELMK